MKNKGLLFLGIFLIIGIGFASANTSPDYYRDGYFGDHLYKTDYSKNYYKQYGSSYYHYHDESLIKPYSDVKLHKQGYGKYHTKRGYGFRYIFDSFYSPEYYVPENKLSRYMRHGSIYQDPYY